MMTFVDSYKAPHSTICSFTEKINCSIYLDLPGFGLIAVGGGAAFGALEMTHSTGSGQAAGESPGRTGGE